MVRYECNGWIEQFAMGANRDRLLRRLRAADRQDRLRVFHALLEGPEDSPDRHLNVHAKLILVDGRFLRIGSSNLNNRSLGLDSECDVAERPTTEAGVEAIRRFRHRTIGHWIGVDGEAFAAAEALSGSVGEAVRRFDTGRMRMLGATPPSGLEQFVAEFQIGDPTSPHDAFRPWRRRVPSHRRRALPKP